MKAIQQLHEASRSGAAMNEAMRRYRGGDMLLAQVAVQYLQWTAYLLAKTEEAAVARPAAAPVVEVCQRRIDGYFDTPDRWPTVDGLDQPLQLLIPAYYAMRAAQRASGHFKPHLLALSCDEAHDVLVGILGRRACQTVSEHKNADLRVLPTVVEPTGEYRSIQVRTFPSGAMRAVLDEARAYPAPEPVRPSLPSPAPTAPPVQEDRTLVWTQRLAGTLIVLERTNSSDSDYSGSSYYSRESYLHLLQGARYRLTEESMSRISYGGLTLGGPSRREERGTWQIESANGTSAVLRLADDEGGSMSYTIADSGSGLMIDGRERSWSGR